MFLNVNLFFTAVYFERVVLCICCRLIRFVLLWVILCVFWNLFFHVGLSLKIVFSHEQCGHRRQEVLRDGT